MDHEVPRLVTASFTGYRRDMGTPVRISRGAPRFIHLPDPRYTMNEHWPFVSELAPGYSYMKTAAPTYARYYLKQLEENAAMIERKLSWIPAEHGQLCLLCFEKNLSAPGVFCHRRMFAQWWEERTGQQVPEVGGGK